MADTDPYPPIRDYALLSDCHSSALVSRTGSIDWACLRRFDAASVFGRILDWERGGSFVFDIGQLESTSRRYLPNTLVLETTLRSADGAVRILDAFAMRRGGQAEPRQQLLRIVEGVEGNVNLHVRFAPRFDYGQLLPWLRRDDSGALIALGADTALVVTASRALEIDHDDACLWGDIALGPGDRAHFAVVASAAHDYHPAPCPPEEIDDRMGETIRWWQRWSTHTVASGPHADAVRRSAIVLKALTCAPTGAVIAAPTTSLPEAIGGERNWDYRYSWIRDSTLVIAALSVVGHEEVARGFRAFLMRTAAGRAADLQIMYGPYGSRFLPELQLDLAGYRGSTPVRIGNGAADQVQNDVYGHVLDAAYLWQQLTDEIDPDEWRFLAEVVEAAIVSWQEPDRGLWEIRGEPKHFVSSKIMQWVALDRGIKLVEDNELDGVDLGRWRRVRDDIRADVDTHGVRDGHFVQHYDTDEVDAGLLLLPMVGFVAATDPRMTATVATIRKDLSVGQDGFIQRYRTAAGHDGLQGDEGVFLMCSFWLVDVLAMQGSDDAKPMFVRLLDAANDLGLYAEELDPASGDFLGNFPQAFTHMALINSAHQLACAQECEEGARAHPWSTADRVGRNKAQRGTAHG